MKVLKVTFKSTGLFKLIDLNQYPLEEQDKIINFYTYDERYYTKLLEKE